MKVRVLSVGKTLRQDVASDISGQVQPSQIQRSAILAQEHGRSTSTKLFFSFVFVCPNLAISCAIVVCVVDRRSFFVFPPVNGRR